MSGLKTLKTRIQSIKSTQKITKAMKLVAASKMRRARLQAEEFINYHKSLEVIVENIAMHSGVCYTRYPIVLSKKRQSKARKTKIFVFGADRGLCGGFNNNIYKTLAGLVEKLNIGNEDLDIVAIGNRAAQHCERFYSDQLVTTYLDATKLIADHNFIATLAKQIQQEYHNHQFAQCYLIFNCFASALSQVPVVKQLIPFYDYDSINHLRIKCTNVIFNPNILDVLEYLIPRFIEAELFYAGSQSLVSEHAARMNAMENATKNSDDMLKQLSLAYNRQRQTIITNELVEIISGAEAI